MMSRSLLFLASFLVMTLGANAQIEGNEQRESRLLDLPEFTELEVHIAANMIIDCQSDRRLEITTDANLFEYLEIENKGNRLILRQKTEIAPSRGIQISLGAPELAFLQTSAAAMIQINGIDQEEFKLVNPAATVLLEGKAEELRLAIESGQVEASRLQADRAVVDIWSTGIATINASEKLSGNISNGGKLIYHGQPEIVDNQTSEGGIMLAVQHPQRDEDKGARFASDGPVQVTIVNKTGEFLQTYVKGPGLKPFSYGLPFQAGITREENWPVGTKVYLVNKVGMRSLLFEIKPTDANGEIILAGG
ncbi:MAG: DUF2807 domain-containing protein [Bacteroidota bacterium]